MHQTTVRFGPDLWEALEVECGRLGVSVAQYLRESALARLAYTAGRRGEEDYELALAGAAVDSAREIAARGDEALGAPGRSLGARREASEQMEAATAVNAQSELIWRRAREVRAQSEALRSRAKRRPVE
jgi:hypothetical protein